MDKFNYITKEELRGGISGATGIFKIEPNIKKVIFNNPATIVIWSDGTKTVVKAQEDDVYSKETGLALCYMKKVLGNKGNFNNVFKKWIDNDITMIQENDDVLDKLNERLQNIITQVNERISKNESRINDVRD